MSAVAVVYLVLLVWMFSGIVFARPDVNGRKVFEGPQAVVVVFGTLICGLVLAVGAL